MTIWVWSPDVRTSSKQWSVVKLNYAKAIFKSNFGQN